ncbi:hypothetical protein DB42_BL00010 [Neochlamydia sp. EPS4]|nr:hypothetical protein DB42_BL00010 [Neochlamydia sp. EPS4]
MKLIVLIALGGRMPHTLTWIVVANSSKAKIYRLAKFPKIEELLVLNHPESRLQDQVLEGRKPGRNFQSGGTTRHAYEPETDPKEVEKEKFARSLGDYICAAHYKGEFTRLYLMANPAFLGLVRHHINTSTQKTIVAEVAKDLTDCPIPEIEHHLVNI